MRRAQPRHLPIFWLIVQATAVVACAREAEPARAPVFVPPPAPAVASPAQSPAAPDPEPQPEAQLGQATYYSNALAGRKTASGERYDPSALTAAHRTLPFGTMVRVVRVDGGRSVVVRVNDRGPFAGPRRIIDLSWAAAQQLDMIRAGVVEVRVERVGSGR